METWTYLEWQVVRHLVLVFSVQFKCEGQICGHCCIAHLFAHHISRLQWIVDDALNPNTFRRLT